MEEMMMMPIRSPENPRKYASMATVSSHSIPASTACPAWKLYENPFYTLTQAQQSQDQHQPSQGKQPQKLQREDSSSNKKQIHHLQLPVSARKIAASFWDLTFIKPLMESELENARAEVLKLKTELEREKKARKKLVSSNKKLAREVSEERKSREALERLCEELAKETSYDKAEINRLQKEIEEERKMLRVAEVLREERVQMKLSDAKLLMEEKLIELEASRQMQSEISSSAQVQGHSREDSSQRFTSSSNAADDSSGEATRTEKSTLSNESNGSSVQSIAMIQRRRASPEAANPHIRRGIKGFVEFPKVIRAIGSKSSSRSSRHSGTKLECQKAQARMLLKQKNPLPANTLITS